LTTAPPTGITAPMMIFKILRADEWAALRASGETAGAPIDVADGFIHLSTAQQCTETARLYFADIDGLFLLALDADDHDADTLKWEVSRGGEKFPHLFAPLRLSDVKWAQPFPIKDGLHQFPAGLS